ncbi:MAG: YfjI family protein, partial [Pseudomonadota bacterium]
MRDKYEKRADYRNDTVSNAARLCTTVYDRPATSTSDTPGDVPIEPQPLQREINPGLPYPVDALGPLKDVVFDVHGTTLAPIEIPAQSTLAVCSLAVQGHVDVETLNGPRPVSLFALTIAQSGERKSSCDAPLMSELRAFEQEQAKIRMKDMTAFENVHALWKGDRDQALLDAKKSRGENRLAARTRLEKLGAEPSPPPAPDRTVTEPTFEGLTRKYVEGMPSLGIFSDEGGQFLGGYAMTTENRQKTVAALNDLWQGNPIRRTRAGDGSHTLFGRRLAMHLMVQPGVARSFMSDPLTADTGFLPRFILCEPASTIGTRLQSRVKKSGPALTSFRTRLRSILETPLPMDTETGELSTRTIQLSSEARAHLSAYSDRIELEQKPSGSYADITGYASKSAEQAARIAGVITAWFDLNSAE